MSFLEILILSFIEGLTEFLPVSSTGHLILTSHFMNMTSNEFNSAFEIIIQFGAILAVVVMYKDQFKLNFNFYKKLFIGFLPAAVLGFLLKDFLTQLLDSTIVVAWALVIGGIIMILVDKLFNRNPTVHSVKDLNDLTSFKIGFMQCLALIPGMSRSASTIIGGQIMGLNRKLAAEFSFFLGVPTLTAAALYKTYKIRHLLHSEQATQLALGIFLSFIFAMLAIKFFIKIVSKYGFFWFGVYRIVVGLLVLFVS